MLIAQQSIAPSAGREDDGGEKKKNRVQNENTQH